MQVNISAKSTKTLKQIRIKVDAGAFDLATLNDENALENALCILEGHFQNPAVDQESLIRDLLSIPNLFAFVVAGLDKSVASSTSDSILAHFPKKAAELDASVAAQLLAHLSRCFWDLSFPAENLRKCYKGVELISPVLRVLSTHNFGDEVRSPALNVDEFDGLFAKRIKQKDRKKIKRATRAPLMDSKTFDSLGVDVPHSQQEAEQLESELIEELKEILAVYLAALRDPEFLDMFKQAYIKGLPTEGICVEGPDAGVTDVSAESPHQEVVPAPSAFPLVRPMKAALYFDSVDGFGDWCILISMRAAKDLRDARRSNKKLFDIILKKIKELSNGHFSDDNQKRLTGPDSSIPIYEAKMTRDTRLVYQVDCIKEFEEDIERQALRIFGVYTHAQLGRDFWNAMGQHLVGKGKEYRKRCVYRSKPMIAGDNVFFPATFPLNDHIGVPISSTKLPNLCPEDRQELHSLLVLEKFVTFSQALLNGILADQDVAHVFHMSTTEQEIVKHCGSCFVLGRSGTGKTTTMLFKMLGIENAFHNLRAECGEDVAHPRQMFVTQSLVLAEKVEEYYTKLAASHSAAHRTAEEMSKLAARQQAREERGLVDRDEEELHRGTLPKSFSELRDEHFPLFVTFDQLCRLLEGDLHKQGESLELSPRVQANADVDDLPATESDYILRRQRSFVSYDVFLHEYWPHLPQGLTKNLDPSLVFSEFMGVIKGSEDSLHSDTGFIDKERYLTISHRQQGTFASRREIVYSLFQAYLKLKRDPERRHWDVADRTHAILTGLGEVGLQGLKLDFIYVDEAQDNLLIDALVLRTVCKNPNGFFWAGDTAQTISIGSSFRFDDLKAFIYRLDTMSLDSTTNSPKSFQLTVNYRSHGGIVNCAHSVVQLISKFWPHAIDSLSEERGIVDGIKPVFFSDCDQDSVHYEQFLFGASGNQIEFGHQQCILVRDDAARERLRQQVGDIGSVLTLYESKGLEFNDVLLLNFFKDSTVDVAQWRVVLNALPSQTDLKCPHFDDTRHNGICRELKFLYVAITRARNNLWIADCSDKGEPLRTYWNHSNLVNNLSARGSVPGLATTSTPEQWAETAEMFFHSKRYPQAMRCYERANMTREKDVAHSFLLREQARSKPVSRGTVDNPRRAAFLTAADAFWASATVAVVEQRSYYRIAAECYLEASELIKAAKAYVLGKEYLRAAQVYRRAGLFDEAVETIENHKGDVDNAEAEKVLHVAKLHYCNKEDLNRAIRLFSDVDDALEFMENYEFNVSRVALLERYGRFAEAAEIHLEEGRTEQAVRLFLRDTSSASQHRAESGLLDGLWHEVTFGVSLGPEDNTSRSVVTSLLALAAEVQSRVKLTTHTLDEINMFRAIVAGSLADLQVLGQKFAARYPEAAVLSLDFAFRGGVKLVAAAPNDVITTLHAFNAYVREMQKLLIDPDLCHNPSAHKLFGFTQHPDSENTFSIPHGSFLYLHMTQSRRVPTLTTELDGYTVNAWELNDHLRSALQQRLRQRVQDEDFQCTKALAFHICPVFAVFGSCNAVHICTGSHDSEVINITSFQLRVRLILQQILVYQSMSSLEYRHVLHKQRSFWISRLYHALFPVHVRAGSSIDIDIRSLPESDRALPIAREWIRDFFYTASFQTLERQGYLSSIAETATLALMLDNDGACTYFNHAPCISRDRPSEFMRNGYRYIVHDLLHFLLPKDNHTLSAGVLFLKTACEKRLPMDSSFVCNMVEQLCAAYAIASQLREQGHLHDLTLGRRWMMRLHANQSLTGKSQQLLFQFVEVLRPLLWEMYTGASGFLLHGGTPRIDYQVRHIFVSRICKSFTLLGLNIPIYQLRTKIQRNIASLRRPDRHDHWIHQRYVNALTWFDLVEALQVTGTQEAGTTEELVRLLCADRVLGDVRQLRGIRSIVYKQTTEIPALLRGQTTTVPQPGPQAPVFVPMSALPPPTDNAPEDALDVEEAGQELESPPDEEDAGADDAVDLDAAAEAVDEGREEQIAIPPTAEEVNAANRLRVWYRRVCSRRRGPPKRGLEAERNRWHLACRELAQDMKKSYRYLYLGPLPLVLVCLDSMSRLVSASKKKAMLRKDLGQHLDYEAIMEKIDRAIAIMKRIRRLKDALKPDSTLHKRQSKEELRTHVKEVQDLVDELPPAFTTESRWDIQTAVKVIVQKPGPPKKAPKPELVVDIDELEYY